MENAPLTQAYDHAKAAALHTYTGSLNAARESHEQAAGNFATAGNTTDDTEALRVLRLLEEHHLRLAKALSSSTSKVSASTIDHDRENSTADTVAENTSSEKSESKDRISKSSNASLAALSIRRPPRRDLTSSIASNLATARGKPSGQRRALPITPEVTAQHVGGKIVAQGTSSQTIPASLRGKASQSPPSTTGNNDSFQTFFNSFETLFSKLSAPLAFTGLPLTNDPASEPTAEQEKPTKRGSRPSTRATADPDLSTLFSAPTLRAISEDVGPAFAHESFYVVPASGGTRSYAGIVRGPSDLEDVGEGSDGEFVDARETMGGSSSPRSAKGSGVLARTGRRVRSPKEARSAGGKTMEELELENNALRQLLDTQSKRLQMWEASAQSQSMALAKSLRFNASARMPPQQQTESERVHELQDQLAGERVQREALEHRNEKMQRENEKLLGVLGKYKDKWEMLKENARQRERRKEEERKASSGN